MTLGRVDMEVTQNEDWTTDIIWSDSFDDPNPVQHPCRMEIRGQDNSTLAVLQTDPNIPDGDIPSIAISPNIGLIQLHLESSQTVTFPPGDYVYDLFVTTGDVSDYGGLQKTPLMGGVFTVNKRITTL